MELRKFFYLVAAAAGLAITAPAGAELDCENRNLNIAATTPTSAFEINGDGTVTDRRTQLQWMQCHLGQLWRDGTCEGLGPHYDWQGALQAAVDVNSGASDVDGDGQPGFAGYTDWRVPNITELWTIVEFSCWSPPVNRALFPRTAALYWSSTPSPAPRAGGRAAWRINLSQVSSADYSSAAIDNAIRVRLVRDAE